MAKTTTAEKRILPRYRVYRAGKVVLGPGKAELLGHIAATGSISEAARLMSMSYNRAWLHVKIMNEGFRGPLVTSTRGGAAGGGAALTEIGQEALALYRELEKKALRATAKTEQQLLALFKA